MTDDDPKPRNLYTDRAARVAAQVWAAGGRRRAVCAALNIHQTTFYSWRQRFPEFKAATPGRTHLGVDVIQFDPEEHLPKIAALLDAGKTTAQVAEGVGIKKGLLISWRRRFPEINEVWFKKRWPGSDRRIAAVESARRAAASRTKYDPDRHPAYIARRRAAGAEASQIAAELEISKATIYNWSHRYPAVRAALNPASAALAAE